MTNEKIPLHLYGFLLALLICSIVSSLASCLAVLFFSFSSYDYPRTVKRSVRFEDCKINFFINEVG